jgi:UDP-N-acetylmuramoyl-L-alanyl-D-glutamate--2,6-diaminopimelate ligase
MGKVSLKADKVILTSDNPRSENPEDIIKDILAGIDDTSNVLVEPDRKKAIFKALIDAKENDIVLIAGKGHEEYQIIKDKVLPFSDRKVVLEFFQEYEDKLTSIS